MNAAVALCHFCERHGPCVVLSTFVEEETEEGRTHDEEASSSSSSVVCEACNPPEAQRAFSSKIGAVRRSYFSRRPPFRLDTHLLLQRACVRSLSCEVCPSQESSVVFFGEAGRGHVISYTFRLKDTHARGLKRCFSFIVLMKDKMYLLNLMPHLSKELEKIAKELQDFADVVYAKDQAICSQRALRLKNNKMPNEAPRSLIELTGKKQIFAFLHTKFCGLLNSCSRIFGEVVCEGLLPKEENFLLQRTLKKPTEDQFSIYDLKKYLGKENFQNALFCTLIGIQLIVRGDSPLCENIVNALEIFLPKSTKCLEYSDYVTDSEARLYYCKSNVAVPKPCPGIFRIDIVDEKPIVHWLGVVPTKWPNLMCKIIKAIDDEMKKDILEYHIIALKEEWINNTTVLKYLYDASSGRESINATKKTMGLKAEDDVLLEYWLMNKS